MYPPHGGARRSSTSFAAVSPRNSSHSRLRPVTEDPAGPIASTLPPPPFEHESLVVGLEWWLDAHLSLASQGAWLEQLLDACTQADARVVAVRGLGEEAEAVRDALYELYCDAADRRLSSIVPAAFVLESHVRATYAWCTGVVALLGQVAGGLRAPEGPDWAGTREAFRAQQVGYPGRDEALVGAVDALGIDTGSPVEPLRNLPRDVEALFGASQTLHESLVRRFG